MTERKDGGGKISSSKKRQASVGKHDSSLFLSMFPGVPLGKEMEGVGVCSYP